MAWALLLWAGLAFAFAPTLRGGLEHLTHEPWTRATLIFPVLAFLAARAERPARPSQVGWLLVAAGGAIQLAAIGGGFVRAGRLGFVLAAIGLCRGSGWCSLPAASLLAFLIPLPHAIHELGSPWLEGGLAQAAAAMVGALGFDVVHGRDALATAGATLHLADHDGGLGLLVLFAGLAWFDWQCDPQRNGRDLFRLGLVCVLAAGAVQLASLALAAAALTQGGLEPAERARSILDRVPWLLVWSSGIVLAFKHRRIDGSAGRDPIAVGVAP
jgi:hypothetical protein